MFSRSATIVPTMTSASTTAERIRTGLSMRSANAGRPVPDQHPDRDRDQHDGEHLERLAELQAEAAAVGRVEVRRSPGW